MADGNSMSFWAQNDILNRYLVTGTPFLALFSTPVDGDTLGTELSAGGYGRIPLTFGAPANAAGLGYPDAHYCVTTADAVFAAATADWNVAGAVIYDASSGGHRIYWETLPSGILVPSGRTLNIVAGNIKVIQD